MQYKTLVNESFLVVILDLQEAFLEGWRIDPDNLPVYNFIYNEINLIRDEERDYEELITENSEESTPAVRKAGRPPAKVK